MIEAIKEHWIEATLAFLSSSFFLYIKRKVKQFKCWNETNELLKQGMLSLLHDRLHQACTYYIKAGKITSAGLTNICIMFKPYEALNGNGEIKTLYERCLVLPIVDDMDDEVKK